MTHVLAEAAKNIKTATVNKPPLPLLSRRGADFEIMRLGIIWRKI